MNKRLSYSQVELVESYDQRRFHGRSGEFVNQKELNLIYSFMNKHLRSHRIVLDSPCGTGRLSQFLRSHGFNLIGLDYSDAMVRKTTEKVTIPLVRGDMFNLPLKDLSIDCIVSLRFLFHYSSIKDIVREIKRTLKNDGIFIFDAFNWSLRSAFVFGDKRTFTHSKNDIRMIMDEIGMKVIDEKHCFLMPSKIYQLLPFRLVKHLDSIERRVPPYLLSRSFWCVKK